jgi:hypothetical protein
MKTVARVRNARDVLRNVQHRRFRDPLQQF